ncbi:MAG: hypothetical protein AB7F67_03830 [Rhodospirillaceae bacterium]
MEFNGTAVSREALLALKPPVERCEIPGVGHVYVKAMSLRERDLYYHILNRGLEAPGEADVVAQTPRLSAVGSGRQALALLCTCDAEGRRMFADDDFDAVGALDYRFLDHIVAKAMEVNKLETAPAEKPADGDEAPAVGNSGAGTTGDSASA